MKRRWRGILSIPLHGSKVGDWLALFRVQSFPVTLIPFCIGYVVSADNPESILPIFNLQIVWILMVGHFSIYGLNDVLDYNEDLKHKPDGELYGKPLVSGRIDRSDAAKVSFTLLLLSVAMTIPMSYNEQFLYGQAVILGLFYNFVSSRKWYSPLLLGVWGLLIVLLGSVSAGGVVEHSILFGVAICVQMIIITMIGTIIDAEANEDSIVNNLETVVTPERFGKEIDMDIRVKILINLLFVLFLVSMSMGVREQSRPVVLILIAVFSGICIFTLNNISSSGFHSEEDDKANTVVYVVSGSVIAFIYLSLLVGPVSLVIGGISIGWGLFWQTIQHGDPLYFP